MPKQNVSVQEERFLDWLRGLSDSNQKRIFLAVIDGTLPDTLASIAGEQPHGLLEITSAIGIQDGSLLIGQSYLT